MDDFLFMGQANSDQCAKLLAAFQSICEELQVPLAKAKTEGRINKLVFSGCGIRFGETMLQFTDR